MQIQTQHDNLFILSDVSAHLNHLNYRKYSKFSTEIHPELVEYRSRLIKEYCEPTELLATFK